MTKALGRLNVFDRLSYLCRHKTALISFYDIAAPGSEPRSPLSWKSGWTRQFLEQFFFRLSHQGKKHFRSCVTHSLALFQLLQSLAIWFSFFFTFFSYFLYLNDCLCKCYCLSIHFYINSSNLIWVSYKF